MASRLFVKRISNEIKMYKRDDFMYPNLLLKPSENDITRWYFVVHSLCDTDYCGGYYFGEIELSKDYPLKPPDFRFHTPNGRFETNKRVCTSFTGFHSSEHASSQNILTISQGIISFMTEESNGIGSIKLCGSNEDKQVLHKVRKDFALQSDSWNRSNEVFKRVFSVEDLEKLPKSKVQCDKKLKCEE
ncbi:putative ubiquitin-conjugating enzyme E2 [Mimivirus AB-566-O17]|uniref:E2 ubiquitin-conjugating enzyme n=1 Tax=Mimivirus AB-566-O17 TaxID=1988039 RepID=A0A1X9VNS5_9VIRU|nr:putative ubiquitin-conjugating enzyme E2 [Mimivirus AB-566-O17]